MLSKNEFNFTKKDEKILPVSFKKKQCKNPAKSSKLSFI